jgi:hypothetical protein
VYIQVFLFSALVGSKWSASRTCNFTPDERSPGTYWIEDWVSRRAGLADMDKWKVLNLPGLELRPVGRQSLYRLRQHIWPIWTKSLVNSVNITVILLQKYTNYLGKEIYGVVRPSMHQCHRFSANSMALYLTSNFTRKWVTFYCQYACQGLIPCTLMHLFCCSGDNKHHVILLPINW